MKIAVTYENGQVFQHFGHTETFKIYDVTDNKITVSRVVPTLGSGHGALVGVLQQNHVDVLLCGGIGGVRANLVDAGIQVYGGVHGNADEAVAAFLEGKLLFDPNAKCDHHEHHGEGHTCGNHGCHH